MPRQRLSAPRTLHPPHHLVVAPPGTVRFIDVGGYMLAQRLFLVAGPLRLLDGDFPDRAFMRSVIEHNPREALALLP